MTHKIQTPPSTNRPKGWHKCAICGMNIYFRSWRDHQREHGDTNAQHIAGGAERPMDPTHVRIKNLKATIARLEAKLAAKSNIHTGDIRLLAEYRSGLVALSERLKDETDAG